MPDSLEKVLGYTLIPVGAVIIGGIIAVFRAPEPRLRSIILHFAAGVVFSAVAIELLPELINYRKVAPLVIGFALGLGLMLGVKRLIGRLGNNNVDEGSNPTELVTAVGVDMFIDGLVVGVSFAAGDKEGILITIALTIELLVLGLSTSSSLTKAGKARNWVIATTTLLALSVIVGAGLGTSLLAGLSGSALVVVLAFATSALLYLVTEELLTEAHTEKDTTLATAMFFVGFLSTMMLETGIY
jgi:ZIP family zinc transporter